MSRDPGDIPSIEAPRWRVEICEYDPAWPRQFAAECDRLRELLHPLVVNIEHVGSTAVPGLAAKAIIDIMIGCESLAAFQPFIATLEQDDWEYVPRHEAAMPFRRFLGKPRSRWREFHLHVVETGCDFWRDHLLFRDTLRREPQTAAAYADLKRRLAQQYPQDRDDYTDAKAPFIQAVLERSRRLYST